MLHTKALYNLFRLNAKEEQEADDSASWRLENFRSLPIEKLFERLSKEGLLFEKSTFIKYAENLDTPEDLADFLLEDTADPKQYDRCYLYLFELWRRLLPEKLSISIFCDELDHRIELYDEGKLESDEPIQDALANLEEILEENSDAGGKPVDVFIRLSEYMAHDLEGFLYDYISDILEEENLLYAQELIDGFSPYMADASWFEFLRAKYASYQDIKEANDLFFKLLKKEPEKILLLEMIKFLSKAGDRSLFPLAVKKILPLLQTQGELHEVLRSASEYYRRLDQDYLEAAILKIMKKIHTPADLLTLDDPKLAELSKVMV